MNTMSLKELRARANELFSSIILFCPDFPSAAQTNTDKEFGQLTDVIVATLNKLHDEEPKQWVQICLDEVQQSLKFYSADEQDKGRDLIQRAEEHFKNAFSKRPTSPRFLVGESGAAQDSESGFPQ